jgi:alpha-ketoglutarate-dependent taurine dioxygenase
VNPGAATESTESQWLIEPHLLNAVPEAPPEKCPLLSKHGVLLFRDLGIENADEFRQFVQTYSGRPLMSYAGGASPRAKLQAGIYNSTEYPNELTLPLHNELSYSETYPRYLYFFCEIEPAAGGETTLGDGRQILKKLDGNVVNEFKRRGGVRYTRFLADDESAYSWKSAFETNDRAIAEERCRQLSAEFEWIDGGLSIEQIGPATLAHPITGDEVWFNQADGFHVSVLDAETRAMLQRTGGSPRLNSSFADGTEFDLAMLDHIRSIKGIATYGHCWRKGDILVIDNVLAMHGRSPFEGPRKIVVAMN